MKYETSASPPAARVSFGLDWIARRNPAKLKAPPKPVRSVNSMMRGTRAKEAKNTSPNKPIQPNVRGKKSNETWFVPPVPVPDCCAE